MPERRFPPPWSADDPETKLGQDCFIVRDATVTLLAYVYFEDESAVSRSARRPRNALARSRHVSRGRRRALWLQSRGYAEDKESAIAAAIVEHKIRPADQKRLIARPR